MQPIAKVVKIHYDQNSADIVFLDNNYAESGVPILSLNGSFQSGLNDLPEIGEQKEEFSIESTVNDVFAYCGFILNKPVIIGFLLPEVCQILFDRIGFKVDRHNSDVYSTLDKDGNFEWSHPSGTYVRVGETTQHEDLTGQDFDKKWKIEKNTEKLVSIHIEVKNGGENKAVLDIDPDGNLTLNTQGIIDIDGLGDVSVDSEGNLHIGSQGNLDIESQGTMTLHSVGAFTVNADDSAVINTPSLDINKT